MAIVDMIYQVYSEEWARIAAHEAASANFRAAKLAERVAKLYITTHIQCPTGEAKAVWEKELAEDIAAYCNAKNCTA